MIINSPTTHGAIGFSTDLPPSMTLGCGSWGGNVTSDNVSPIHLMDIKRVAFGRTVNAGRKRESAPTTTVADAVSPRSSYSKTRRDSRSWSTAFCQKSQLRTPGQPHSSSPPPVEQSASPGRTIIHELRPPSENGAKPVPLDFVSENDVRNAIEEGKKIYITPRLFLRRPHATLAKRKIFLQGSSVSVEIPCKLI